MPEMDCERRSLAFISRFVVAVERSSDNRHSRIFTIGGVGYLRGVDATRSNILLPPISECLFALLRALCASNVL